MLLVAPVKKELCKQMTERKINLWHRETQYSTLITACNHSRGLPARVQTVSATTNPRYYKLISASAKDWLSHHRQYVIQCGRRTYVCTPQDAYRCFENRDGCSCSSNQILFKNEQPKQKDETWTGVWTRLIMKKLFLKINFVSSDCLLDLDSNSDWLVASCTLRARIQSLDLWIGIPGLILGLVYPRLLHYPYKVGWH